MTLAYETEKKGRKRCDTRKKLRFKYYVSIGRDQPRSTVIVQDASIFKDVANAYTKYKYVA